jgi:DNA-binding beta-propeller fold protein YncE
MKQRRISLCFASMLATAVISGLLAVTPAVPAMAAFAYVVGGALSGGTPEIAVIDANPTSSTFNSVIAAIPNTSLATKLAITPDGSRGYVINNDGTVSVIDTNPSSTTFNSVVATITPQGNPVGPPAFGIAITPDGSRAYSGWRSDSSGNVFASVIDTVPTSLTYNQVIATINSGLPNDGQGIAVTPDGSRAYLTGLATFVPCGTTPPFCNITTTTGQTFACPGPLGCNFNALIEVVNTATNTIDPNPPPVAVQPLRLRLRPMALAPT